MRYLNTEQKGKLMWTYSANKAPNLTLASAAFNACAPFIKQNTIEELYILIDEQL